MPPGTVHFSQQLEKCRKEPGETKVSPLPCALCRVRNCNLVPHVRGGFSLSQRIKGLSPAAAPLPLMPSHGRGACIYRAGGAEPRPYGVWQGVRASARPLYKDTKKSLPGGSDFFVQGLCLTQQPQCTRRHRWPDSRKRPCSRRPRSWYWHPQQHCQRG